MTKWEVWAPEDGYWMACEHPERPPDDKICYHVAPGTHPGYPDPVDPHPVCTGCYVVAEVQAVAGNVPSWRLDLMREGKPPPDD